MTHATVVYVVACRAIMLSSCLPCSYVTYPSGILQRVIKSQRLDTSFELDYKICVANIFYKVCKLDITIACLTKLL